MAGSSIRTKQKKRTLPTVGLFLRSLDNDYQQRLREDALAVGDRLGLKIHVESASNDQSRQFKQISKALTEAPKVGLVGVLVSPVKDDILLVLARAAGRAGVGWGLLNRDAERLRAVRDEFPSVPIFGVTPDQMEIGRLQGRQVARVLPEGAHIIYLMGQQYTSSAETRRQGFEEILAGRLGSITNLYADWTFEGGRLAVERWFASANIVKAPSAIVAQNDDMALGARHALRDVAAQRIDLGLAELPILGCDGSPSLGQRLVTEERLRATIIIPSVSGQALELIASARADEERPPLQTTLPVESFPPLQDLAPVQLRTAG